MHRYLLRRFGHSCLLLVVVTMATFTLILVAPGGPTMLLDPNASADDIARMRQILGLDEPVAVQYLKWMRQIAQGNFGVSYSAGRPVFDLIRDSVPATLILSGSAFLFAILSGVTLGILSAVKRYA